MSADPASPSTTVHTGNPNPARPSADIGLVVLFSLGVVGLSMARGKVDRTPDADGVAIRGGRAVGSVLAGTCFVLCALAVLYGLYLEIPQFHG